MSHKVQRLCQSSNTQCHGDYDDDNFDNYEDNANLIDHPILKIVAEGENAHLVDHVKLSRSENKSAEMLRIIISQL